MLSRSGAGLAALALIVGFATAPYTHLHRAGHDVDVDGHHAGTSLRHAHLAPHAARPDHDHPPAAGAAGDHDPPPSDVVAADDFVFQAGGDSLWQLPAVLTAVVTLDDRTSVWLGVPLSGPPAHGPPSTGPSAPRAPPVFPPAML